MSNVERLRFVIWASARDPKFTLSRRAYTQARWDWRKLTDREKASIIKV